MSEVVRCQGLSKRFSEGGLDVQVLQGIDLTVEAGETPVVVFAYQQCSPAAVEDDGRGGKQERQAHPT